MSEQEIHAQVARSLGAFQEDYDIAAIADEIAQRHGSIDAMPQDEYWELVEKHELQPSV